MKKFIIIIAIFFSMQLSAQEHFKKYRDNQNETSYIQAIQEYWKQAENSSTKHTANLMIAYLSKMELDKRLDNLIRDLDSLETRTQFQLANLMLSLNRYTEAVEIYDKLNENSPKWSCPWRHKGEALMKAKEFNKSEKALLKAIETRKTHYDAYTMLAEVQHLNDKNEEALKTLEIGFTYKGKDIEEADEEVVDADIQFLYLKLLKLNKLEDKYKEQLEKVKQHFPNDERLSEFQ